MLRLLSIGLITLLLYQSAGFIVTFELGVSAIRKEVKEKLIQKGEGSIVRLAFHKSSRIAFKDEGKEIYHQSNMYDILRQEIKGDSLIFTCFHDIAESKLVADFEQEVKAITDQEQSKNKNNKSVHKKYEYIQSIVSTATVSSVFHLAEHHTLFEGQLSNTYLLILYPPPEVS
ncbi:hypothetical protein SanaruYs_15670 [Chryseotalea sanaruensis]|uniref:Uncharacterized protein n=1 Tax=Chryseotalea sanaruensis TaxID=2482724 RepID=A0A401U8X1_9BACT|nr:hypothetical protein [Chryseotalea sanaruensis]GCC51342.1 hypothetical protein SanaruYs_15670 [Chryseotalea sanaruensis]